MSVNGLVSVSRFLYIVVFYKMVTSTSKNYQMVSEVAFTATIVFLQLVRISLSSFLCILTVAYLIFLGCISYTTNYFWKIGYSWTNQDVMQLTYVPATSSNQHAIAKIHEILNDFTLPEGNPWSCKRMNSGM